MRQQRLVNITCYQCSQKCHYKKDCNNSAGTSPVSDQTASVSIYSLATMVTQTVTASYGVSQSSFVTIFKSLQKWNRWIDK